jgi:hypothetical protein
MELIEARPRDEETDALIVKAAEKRLRLVFVGVPNWHIDT